MTEASSVPDTALGLWLEVFAWFGDEPFLPNTVSGELKCIFCNKVSPSPIEQRHEPDCIWMRAKALVKQRQ